MATKSGKSAGKAARPARAAKAPAKAAKATNAPAVKAAAPSAKTLLAVRDAESGYSKKMDRNAYKAAKASVGHLIDSKRGGLTRAAYTQFSGNAVVVKAAKTHREAAGKEI